MKKLLITLMASVMLLASVESHAARRLGGGGSIGKQSSNVTQRQAAPAPTSPAAPSPTQAPGATPSPAQAPAAATAPKPATAPAATPPGRPWGAMLGGLAAGLGLAWLANSLGLGAQFAQFMLFALLALVVMAVIGMVMRSRRAGSPYALQGAGAPADLATAPRQYSPDKVGNDASARPWEQTTTAFDTSAVQSGPGRLQIGSALGGSQNWGIPADFDVNGFVSAAKRNFITLQDAWDRSDVATLRAMMTDEMVAEIRNQLAERESLRGAAPNKTDVVMLEAQLLGIEDLGEGYMASVEFSGMIREEPSAGPSAFREVWNMTKPKNGSSGWLVAGVQALQ